jgi:SAM-dependent methyltransferase
VLVPFIYSGAPVSVACRLVASGAAGVLRACGAQAMANGPLVTTARGAYVVTAECLLTPLIPLWVVAVLSVPLARWQRVVGLALTLPVLGAVAVARLLVLAAPPALVESPLLVVHGFHQLVLFAAIAAVASYWAEARTEGRLGRAGSKTALVLGATLLVSLLVGRLYDATIVAAAGALRAWAPHALITLLPPGDVQGALALLPVFQVALLGALAWVVRSRVVRRRLAAAALVLWASQVSLLVLLGELAARVGFTPHALAIRAWAVGWPLVLAFLTLDRRAARAGKGGPEDYRGFWDRVGAEFPDLGGAASTELYRANEVRLISEHVPDLASKRVLKTDLWDEARNTRILQWMEAQGAVVAGIDISGPVIRLARREFDAAPLLAAGADVRALPFADATFDFVYSMGTIEHFAESDVALRECLRVLKPGGLALVGVPNRLDPFLRPALVRLLSIAGLYAYGREKSYSRKALGRLVESAGFDLVGEDGILFIPGWLRMLDLFFHTRWPALATMTTRIPVRVFGWIDRRFPAVRRHGYLIVAVARRPAAVAAEELEG